jgi:hypothetical protein
MVLPPTVPLNVVVLVAVEVLVVAVDVDVVAVFTLLSLLSVLVDVM